MTVSSKWRAALATAAASAALVATPVVGAQTAQAQPYPPPPPGVTLSDTTVDPGDSITFEGTGFEGGQEVEADLFSTKIVLGHFIADPDGTVEGTVTIPERTKPGEHIFALVGEDPELTACAHLYVNGKDHDHDPQHGGQGGPGHHPDRPHLAHTGDNSPYLLGGAAALVLLGGGGVMAARRLKRH